MRIVFLDFDGVLNSHAFVARRPIEEHGKHIGLDPLAIERLNRLLREASAEVVVSSTWRHRRDCAQLQTVLTEKGFVGKVLGKTPRYLKNRGEEIQAWLYDAPNYGIEVESFVILDDDSDMAHLMDRLIKTTFDDGLLDEHVDRAVTMLCEPQPLLVLPQ